MDLPFRIVSPRRTGRLIDVTVRDAQRGVNSKNDMLSHNVDPLSEFGARTGIKPVFVV